MTGHILRAVAVFLLCLLVASASMGLSVQAESDTAALSNTHTSLRFHPATGRIVSWEIAGQSMAAPHQLTGSDGTQLLITGAIAGRTIDAWTEVAGGWDVASHSDSGITLRLHGIHLPFVLEQRWKLTEALWATELEVHLHALEAIEAPELLLMVGSGIGETPQMGLGAAESLYSFTEVIFAAHDAVGTVRHSTFGARYVWEDPAALQWIGLHSRYFALILSPLQVPVGAVYSTTPDTAASPDMAPEFASALHVPFAFTALQAGQEQSSAWKVFAGGKSYEALAQNGLSALLFAGLWEWMRWLTLGIMHLLFAIQAVITNWGIAIIGLAVLVRMAIHPLARRALAAQRHFAALQEKINPEVAAIKSQYNGAEQSERILHVYEKYRVSPLAGLKPLLIVGIQIPIFMALLHLLGQAFELREAGFLWIETLAQPDRLLAFGGDLPFFGSYFNVLPLLMSATNILSIVLSPAPADGEKHSVRKNLTLAFFALTFFLLFYSFPSGMVLYWTMANVLHLAHTLWAARRR